MSVGGDIFHQFEEMILDYISYSMIKHTNPLEPQQRISPRMLSFHAECTPTK